MSDVLAQVAAVAGIARGAELEAAAIELRQMAHVYHCATDESKKAMAEARLYLAAVRFAELLKAGA